MQKAGLIVVGPILLLMGVLLSPVCAGQGVLDSPTQKLDKLLEDWHGHTLSRLQEVWGRESSIESHRGHKVYVYERRVKVRAGVFAVSVYPKGGLRCVVRFEVDEKNEIVRTSRQGGGQECWSRFRKYDPR